MFFAGLKCWCRSYGPDASFSGLSSFSKIEPFQKLKFFQVTLLQIIQYCEPVNLTAWVHGGPLSGAANLSDPGNTTISQTAGRLRHGCSKAAVHGPLALWMLGPWRNVQKFFYLN